VIIANIGGEQYALETLADANVLLEILSRAKPVDDGYITKDYDRVYFELSKANRRREFEIKVVRGELLTQEQFDAKRAENGVTA
jgi:hypothetical protein